jgi:mitochondrial fission protein ELM1
MTNAIKTTCWVVTSGKAGMENQSLGLAETLGCTITVKRIALRAPWKYLTPYLRWGLSHCLSSKSDKLTPPWPQLVIATGRQSILPALYVKQASKGMTALVYIQNPGPAISYFNAVVVPEHDRLTGPNVVLTRGALHRVTPARLAAEKEKFPQLAALPSPRIAVLLGGANRAFRFDADVADTIIPQLQQLRQKYNASLLISPSRRTDPAVTEKFQQELNYDNVYLWDGQSENPYFAFLGLADAILVTSDSISMISEACSTGKPVYMLPLPGNDHKFARFHEMMVKDNYVKWFQGDIDFSEAKPLDEMISVARKVQSLLG